MGPNPAGVLHDMRYHHASASQQGEPDILQHRKIHGPGGNDIRCPDPAGKMGGIMVAASFTWFKMIGIM